jgi:hypothetical protein
MHPPAMKKSDSRQELPEEVDVACRHVEDEERRPMLMYRGRRRM